MIKFPEATRIRLTSVLGALIDEPGTRKEIGPRPRRYELPSESIKPKAAICSVFATAIRRIRMEQRREQLNDATAEARAEMRAMKSEVARLLAIEHAVDAQLDLAAWLH